MSRPSHVVEHELQRHGDALRAHAGVLVRDPNAADDAVQEVWLAALQRPPRHQSALGGWLATALHNAVRMWRRGERRRERREEIVRSARGCIDRGDTVAREERGRPLLTAVESLEQRFRDAIWQRFFEGKAPRIPLGTATIVASQTMALDLRLPSTSTGRGSRRQLQPSR